MSESLHYPAMQEYTLNTLTNAMNFSIKPISSKLSTRGICYVCISCKAVGEQGDSMAQQPSALAQDSLQQEVGVSASNHPGPQQRGPVNGNF